MAPGSLLSDMYTCVKRTILTIHFSMEKRITTPFVLMTDLFLYIYMYVPTCNLRPGTCKHKTTQALSLRAGQSSSTCRVSVIKQHSLWGQFTSFILLFTEGHLSHFTPSPFTLRTCLDNYLQNTTLTFSVWQCLAVATKSYQGYLSHSVVAHSVCSGTLHTPIYWWWV